VECIEENVVGWVDGEKKARSLPESASLLHFGPDRSYLLLRQMLKKRVVETCD
jgi:hypothetical protein